METVLFYFLGAIAVLCGIFMVLHRNPVYSGIFLVQSLFAVAGLYLLLHAQFLAIIQLLVYAGAIIVLFLFVLMLLNLRSVENEMKHMFPVKVFGIVLAIVLVLEISYLLSLHPALGSAGSWTEKAVDTLGSTEVVGKALFTTYLFPFEVSSVVLLVAMIGMVVLAKRHIKE
jgi:NADH-quinone oxidoreductase subunit J